MRRTQERDFNFQRSADVRLDRFKYFADDDSAPNARHELRFRVKNIGHAFAAEMNFAVDNGGMLHYVQSGLGLPPGPDRELTVALPPDPALAQRQILLRYRYDDYRRHWGEVRLSVPDVPHEHIGQYRQPRILSARLDGKRNPAIAESDVWVTPMALPRWYDGMLRPYRRWRFRREHPELFDR